MNGLNQMIAQGVDPIQIQSPVNQLAQFEQIRGAQQQTCCANSRWPRFKESVSNSRRSIVFMARRLTLLLGAVDETKLYGGLAQSAVLGHKYLGCKKQSLSEEKRNLQHQKNNQKPH
jgi:hypothetical protein